MGPVQVDEHYHARLRSEAQQRDWTAFDPATGTRAITWADGRLWGLGLNSVGDEMVIGDCGDDPPSTIIGISDDSACGLTARNDTLWVAYPDRRFQAIPIP